jgi:hypothetical protein
MEGESRTQRKQREKAASYKGAKETSSSAECVCVCVCVATLLSVVRVRVCFVRAR